MRIFAGDWVKNMLTRLGMQEGEAIESRMVTRRIEAAQKKVEERHFDVRKHLLEYDEVMDEQRKRVYSYRQKILDGGNCRQLILEMIGKQIDQGVPHLLEPAYRWQTVVGWAAHEMGLEVDPRAIEGMDRERLEDHLRHEAARQAEEDITEKIEEDLPETAEDQSEWNWLALSKWVNVRYGLNTNDRELKKIGARAWRGTSRSAPSKPSAGSTIRRWPRSRTRNSAAARCAGGCTSNSRSKRGPRSLRTSRRTTRLSSSAKRSRSFIGRRKSSSRWRSA